MRKLVLLGLLAMPLAFACKPSGGGADAGPSASATAPATSAAAAAPTDDGAAASASASGVPEAGPAPAAAMPPTTPVIGQPCHPGVDTVGCGPDHLEDLTCQGGTWRVLQTCRGAGHCQGVGASTTCSVGELRIGDSCVAANAPGHCLRPKAFVGCESGKWQEVACPGPLVCRPNGAGPGQPACK